MDFYQYKPLKYDWSIRLIQFDSDSTREHDSNVLAVHLTEAQLDNDVDFEALSYTWGGPGGSSFIQVGGRMLRITSNLYSFLKRLREDGRGGDRARPYWADQICINQSDIAERNRQVALMAQIYRQSQKTLVWLGETDDDVHLALKVLREIDDLGFGRDSLLGTALPRVVQSAELLLGSQQNSANQMQLCLYNLFNRAWFTRAWVVQEVAVAGDCTVRVSGEVFRWESLDLAILALASMDKKTQGTMSGSLVLKTKAAAALRHIQYCRKEWTSRNAQKRQHDFLYLLGRLSPAMECTDPRDRVYAYLSLQQEPQVLEADYALSVDEVFVKTSFTIAAASKCLDIFAFTRYPPIGPNSATSQAPSWAIDWRMPSTMSSLATKVNSNFCASGDFQYYPSHSSFQQLDGILSVRGRVIDMVSATFVGHQFPRAGDPLALMECLEHHEVLQMASHLYPEQSNPAGESSNTLLYHGVVKVLLCYDRKLDDADGRWNEDLESALKVLEAYKSGSAKSSHDKSFGVKSIDGSETALLRRFTSKTNRKSMRTLFLTRATQMLGLAPPLSRVGDLVCIIHGSRTPIILRAAATPGQFHVMGQAYVEGWMHGENITWREEEGDVFQLC
ncbi:heterokaryon incompatibility protein-domain-containing protein [Lasiosphaeris hirsuta]|uniref:Heterokaryon incompatibility protein-domain-containing protein n=1 Tax=Lasiosphaeris hirsuta TaxID=260670 RepID=A0AA40APA1_9PEZI|nr:heterokaryon incompatibility protein-domain-containing protein [Lasiosphaeris hirsuta]